MLRVAHDIGRILRDKPASHVFVFRSTLVPGTVEDVLRPILERESGKKDGVGFHLCFQPEFLREGTSIRDYDNPPFTIVGAASSAPIETLKRLFGHLPCEFHSTSIRAAEMVKYCCNNFHALKITFANETARVCEAMGVDPFEVMDLVCKDRQLNISPAYLKPGFAFGGSCLPKDLRATMHLAKMRDVELPMLSGSWARTASHRSRDQQGARFGERRIGMIGLSFKTGTDDLRESPLVLMAEHFIGKGLSLSVYDPEVHLSRLLGANRRFIEQHLPHIGSMIRADIETVIEESGLLVVGIAPAGVREALERLVRPDQIIVDLVNLPNRANIRGHYEGLCW
jgi:GDP-mannose 6-dehydrogenase